MIKLVVDDRPGSGWRESWRKDKNARGEALVLLRDGHLLVAKQKEPVRLIEFGPRDAGANGINSQQFLPNDEPFSWPSERVTDFEPLDSWGLDKDDADLLESVNDLAVLGGELYAISRESRVVARLKPVPEEGLVAVEHRWQVPERVRNPEGLVLPEQHGWIVADDLSREEDQRGDSHNIFVLQPSTSA